MRVFLAVSARPHRQEALIGAVRRAEEAAGAAFPASPARVRGFSWARAGVHVLAWSNEPGWEPRIGPGGITVTSGHHPGEPGPGPAYTQPGCFALLRADEHGLTASTSIAPADPVYVAETPDLVVVGNRALLVRLAAHGAVRYDVAALQSIARQGYFLSEETPFEGVRALPPASFLEAGDRLRVTTEPLTAGRGRTGFAKVAERMLSAVSPLRGQEPVRVTLTGGRDSRLIAALLHGAGIPFRASTSGFDDHPDVVVARRVAAALGVEHEVTRPVTQAGDLSVLHPADRVQHVLRVCEGMLSAYENITADAPYSDVPRLGGHNGEILRGGYLSAMEETTPEAVRKRTQTLFLANRALFTEAANAHAEDLAWTSTGIHVPDHLYVRFRVGRWHAAARAAMLRQGTPVQPFLDNRVVAAALSLDPGVRRSERLVHRLIKTFAPPLAGVPLEGGDWRFRTEGVLARWRRRAERRLSGKAAKPFNWRAEPGPELAEELARTITSCDRLGEIVRMEKVPALFDGGRLVKPAFVWQLYTVATLLGTDLTVPAAAARGRVTVPTKRPIMTS
ncbi:asparagine synthase-related protein [Nonomuraea typhae]|uniref:asparagine synthase-related protein n=1 Tax=Nonomuraea typhae TaxID=2603600 RepID=UPI0012F83B20|nr:asparagine synthase-related protein [Nonomuraea typhae]